LFLTRDIGASRRPVLVNRRDDALHDGFVGKQRMWIARLFGTQATDELADIASDGLAEMMQFVGNE